jgi:hypothetical protein
MKASLDNAGGHWMTQPELDPSLLPLVVSGKDGTYKLDYSVMAFENRESRRFVNATASARSAIAASSTSVIAQADSTSSLPSSTPSTFNARSRR